MTDKELAEIISAIDTALAVFQRHTGKLTGAEISVKSMLLALRLQIMDQQKRLGSPSGPTAGS